MAGVKHDVVIDDEADVAPRQASSVGKRIKAITFTNGTTVVVRSSDFKKHGVNHHDVTWDYRIDDFTVAVGKGITAEAADFLTGKFPDSFVYLGV